MTSGILNRRLTSPKDLVEAGLAEPVRLPELETVAELYAIGLTPALAALVRPEDPSDPIARQFVLSRDSCIVIRIGS
jgi:lysine 2,3-aminomutase